MLAASNRIAATVIAVTVLWTTNSIEAQQPAEPSGQATATQSAETPDASPTLNPLNWNLPSFKTPQWKMPNFGSLLPAPEDKERIIKKKDNLFTDISSTAKSSWQRTKEALDPQKLNPMKMFATSDSPETSAESERPGFFRSLFAAPEPEERVANVNDFLGQDRPMR